jgi:hypothetical protein
MQNETFVEHEKYYRASMNLICKMNNLANTLIGYSVAHEPLPQGATLSLRSMDLPALGKF